MKIEVLLADDHAIIRDARMPDDGAARRLLTFPDGTAIDVLGRRQLVLRRADGTAADFTVTANLGLDGTLTVRQDITFSAVPNLGKDEKDPTHTANFGVKLQEHCKANGVTCELYYPGIEGIAKSATEYLVKKLKE